MEFKIVAFHPENPVSKNSDKIGTVCVLLVGINLELKGISVFRNKDKFFFRFPGTYGLNEKKEKVRYSFFHFLDEDMEKTLIEFLIAEFKKHFPRYEKNTP